MIHPRANIVRRLFERLDVALPAVAIRSASDALDDATVLSDPVLLDISATGARIRASSSDVAIGDRVALAFSFSGFRYRAVGTVVWAGPDTDPHAVLIGLRFERLETPVRDRLIRNIAIQKHRARASGPAAP